MSHRVNPFVPDETVPKIDPSNDGLSLMFNWTIDLTDWLVLSWFKVKSSLTSKQSAEHEVVVSPVSQMLFPQTVFDLTYFTTILVVISKLTFIEAAVHHIPSHIGFDGYEEIVHPVVPVAAVHNP